MISPTVEAGSQDTDMLGTLTVKNVTCSPPDAGQVPPKVVNRSCRNEPGICHCISESMCAVIVGRVNSRGSQRAPAVDMCVTRVK